MKDLEDRLAESLGHQGASVRPAVVPFDDVVVRAHRRVRRRRAAGALGVAAAVLAGGVVWSAARPDDGQVIVVDDPAIATDDSSSLPDAAGSWTVLSDAPLSARRTPSVVWTGSEFIVWGGVDASNTILADGAAYDPAAGTWRPISPNSFGLADPSAVWDGEKMIVASRHRGAVYDPVRDAWGGLTPIDAGGADEAGADQLVMAGDDVVAIRFGRDGVADPGIRQWRLGDLGWEELGGTDAVGGPGWLAIGRPDGVVMWNPGDGATVQYRFGGEWSVYGRPPLPERSAVAGDVRLVWAGGAVRAVLPLIFPDPEGNETMIATLEGTAWSEPGPTIDVLFALAETVVFGNDAVLLGGRFDGEVDPMLLDGATGSVQVLGRYPIDTIIDQGVAASADQLFVWGGQTNSIGEQSTASSPVNATGALWTRSRTASPSSTAPTSTSAAVIADDGVGALGATPGTVLDLSRLTGVEPPTRTTTQPFTSIQSGRRTLDGRFVVAAPDGRVLVVRPDGTIDVDLTVDTEPGWSLVDAALGPLDVLYLSESSAVPGATGEIFRFTAVPTSGSQRGQRAASASVESNCVETWCGQIEFTGNGVEFSDLGFYSPPEFGAVDVGWPPLPTMSATAGNTGETDPVGIVSEATEFVTVTMPDGTVRNWRVRITDTGLAEGSVGFWMLQPDGTVVGVAGSTDGRQYLVTLSADGSGFGIMTAPFPVYAAVRGDAEVTLVTFRDGAVHLDTYPG